MTGRPSTGSNMVFYTHHMDVERSPRYPFGYGLSYSTFSYSPVTLIDSVKTAGTSITAKVTVTNNSAADGEEVVQLYIRDVVGSITRPVLELKGFQKSMIKAGESKEFTFDITDELLSFYRKDFSFGTEPGEFEVFVGPSSAQLQSASFTLK